MRLFYPDSIAVLLMCAVIKRTGTSLILFFATIFSNASVDKHQLKSPMFIYLNNYQIFCLESCLATDGRAT